MFNFGILDDLFSDPRATLIVLLSGIQYVLRLCINNIGGTLPYTFCW